MQPKGYAIDAIGVPTSPSRPGRRGGGAGDGGKGRVDILVNNAGVARADTPAEDTSDEHWLHMDVNLDGVFWCCRAFGRQMLAAGRGSIVNIGSMSGFIVNKPQPQAFYNASKAAVHHLTKSLAAEWGARGVRVNAVAPTYIETPLTTFGRTNKPMFETWIDGRRWGGSASRTRSPPSSCSWPRTPRAC